MRAGPRVSIVEVVAVAGDAGPPHLVWGEDLPGLPAALADAEVVVVADKDPAWGAGLGRRRVRLGWYRPPGGCTDTAAAAAARGLRAQYHGAAGLPDWAWPEVVEWPIGAQVASTGTPPSDH